MYTGGMGSGKRNAEGRRLLEFCNERELCVANTWFYKADKRKITSSAGGYKKECDVLLVGEKYRKYIRHVKVISLELQLLVVLDLDIKVLKKVVRKQRIIRRKIWILIENQTRIRLEKRIKELINTGVLDLWKT